MFKSYGLHSYVLNNNLKSLALLAGFLAVVQLMFAAIWASAGIAFMSVDQSIETGKVVGRPSYFTTVLDMTWSYSPAVLVLSLVWAFLAFLYYKSILRRMTGLLPASRIEEPRLFNTVENLSIALGMTTPRIEISESHKLNAFAMGLTPSTSSIGVTRGLLLALNDKELEAVIAHELTHIRTLDVRLMTFATIFCGIIFSMGWFLTYRFREYFRNVKAKPAMLIPVVIYLGLLGTIGPLGFLWQIPLVTGTLIMSALIISLGLRFAISRTREFVADLGACELTKNPEALISALAKIHGRDLIPHCDPTVQAMMISAPAEGLFASHPSIEDRIDAIVTYAATHLNGLRLAPASARRLSLPDDGEVKSGFSITNMKDPAWVSKPLIVLPALASGLFMHYLTSAGPGATFAGFYHLPGLMVDIVHAPMTGTTFSSTSDMRGTLDTGANRDNGLMGFINGMSLGEWKIMLFYLCIGSAMAFGAKYLRGLGYDTPMLRKLAGGPSKVMESDWDEADTKTPGHQNERRRRSNRPCTPSNQQRHSTTPSPTQLRPTKSLRQGPAPLNQRPVARNEPRNRDQKRLMLSLTQSQR